MSEYTSIAVLTIALLFGAAAHGAEPPADLEPALRSCIGCHGRDGVSTRPDVPTIAGISAGVHADALYAYKEGERSCETAKVMCSVSSRLSEKQIEGIAGYFASLHFIMAAQETDPAKAARGAEIHQKSCEKCHSESGSVAADDASILAGQWMPYLRDSLVQFRDGKRSQPPAMKSKMVPLSDEDIDALVHFYGSAK